MIINHRKTLKIVIKVDKRTMFTLSKNRTNMVNLSRGRSFATYYNGTIVPQKSTLNMNKINMATHWKHPMIFAKVCPNCKKIQCNNLKQTFCKYHSKTNKKFLENKIQTMKKSMFIGTTTHGIPKLDAFEKKFKDVVPLSMRDMDGFRQPKGTVYNAVLLKRPLSAQGVLIQKNINRTAFLQDDKIQNRLNLYIKHNQNIHAKSVRVRPKALRYVHRYKKIKTNYTIKKPNTTNGITNETSVDQTF